MKRVTERGVDIPPWPVLEKQDLRIWEVRGQAPRLLPGQSQPKGDSGRTQGYRTWSVRSAWVFFQQYVHCSASVWVPLTHNLDTGLASMRERLFRIQSHALCQF
jgi:hypothetical protein